MSELFYIPGRKQQIVIILFNRYSLSQRRSQMEQVGNDCSSVTVGQPGKYQGKLFSVMVLFRS
jgi:hypothetical protein